MNIINQFTLRTLMKNKVRTLVTIIGIALSAAMFTAVTSSVVSFQNYLIRVEIAVDGAWEGRLEGCSASSAEIIKKDEEIKSYTQVANFGYAVADGCKNENKPYLFIAGIGKDFTDFTPVSLIEGRLPENNEEIVLPNHLKLNGGVDFAVGDTYTLQVGKRVYADGKFKGETVGGQSIPFQSEEEGGETIADAISKSYTVVGICERPPYEPYSAPGYTALTFGNEAEAESYDLLMSFEKPENAAKTLERLADSCTDESVNYTTHSSLLRFMGRSTNSNYNKVLYRMGAILILVILFGSVSLIYNAFSISVSERTKQFGLLKSIGATKKQMRQSVLFEACVLSVAGIFIGILAGLGGMGITFHFIAGMISPLWATAGETGISLTLVVTWQSVVLAAVIAFATVIISALIPARRAVKLSPMQAICQTSDVRIRPEKVKTSGLTYRLFGFEGMLASKNFKRSRKQYRATVLSLFMSIVLFVTATSFGGYLTSVSESIDSYSEYDINFYIDEEDRGKKTDEDIAREVEGLSSVDEIGYANVVSSVIELPIEYLDEKYLKVFKPEEERKAEGNTENDKTVSMDVNVYFVRDSTYREYLKKEGLDESMYMDGRAKSVLIWDNARAYVDERLVNMNMLKKNDWSGKLDFIKPSIDGYYYWKKEGGKYIYTDGESDKEKAFSSEEACSSQMDIKFGKVMNKTMPLGASSSVWNGDITILLPYSAIPEMFSTYSDMSGKVVTYASIFHVRAENHAKAYEEITKYLSNGEFGGGASSSVYDESEARESERTLLLVIDIFSYGFIILISLISVANVFNTISTNINLRRQEFAMLKSVGMSGKGFQKMMNYECALYGLKGILYGVPVSCLISWFMYSVMAGGEDLGYIFPWQGILISSVSVFLVVFATMLYSMRKVKKDNTIEALRNENI